MKLNALIEQLQSKKSQFFIRNNLEENTNKLRLKYSKKNDLPYQACIDQIEARQRLKKKNLAWLNTPNILFPPKLNIEQSSSDTTAKYKANLAHGDYFIDLTGGMGVDTYAFSKNFEQAVYCELSESLYPFTAHNFRALNANIETFNENGFDVLSQSKNQFDLVYVDPARRHEGRRMVSLKDCKPDITVEFDLIFKKSNQLLIKASPLLDISQVLSEIPFVKEVHVVSVNNECKELLFLSVKNFENHPRIMAVNIAKDKMDVLSNAQDSIPASFGSPKRYLLEPNASIMKAGLFNELAQAYNLVKLEQNSHLFTTDLLPHSFPGKVFEIQETMKPFRQSLKGESFNIVAKNFGLKPEQIKRKLKTKDGGARFLFATTLNGNKKAFILCKKVDYKM